MHPALSIILFTTLSGGGLGLGFWTLLLAPAYDAIIFAALVGLAILLGAVGLICSIFHLRRPTRAWRALSQWRSSWLSREGIIAPAALAVLFLVGAITMLGVAGWPVLLLRAAGAILALSALYATAMIYAQIRAVPAWNSPLTPVFFLSFATAGGWLLFTAVLHAYGLADSVTILISMLLVALAWAAKIAWWRNLDRCGTGSSSLESATGIRDLGKLRLLEPPHTGSNYLTSEMVFVVARKHAQKLRRISLLTGGVLPLACLTAALLEHLAVVAIFCAAILHFFGVGISRWLFFAEARHTVSLYYGGHAQN